MPRHERPIRPLGRGVGRLQPKRKFLLFCEGRNTEPRYFAEVRRLFSDALVEIDTRGGVGVPMRIAEEAIKEAELRRKAKRRKGRLDFYEQSDEIWAIFDRDEHPEYKNAVNACERASVRVGRSNPCFEIWLILHIEDFHRPDGRHAVQKHLERLRPDYCPDGSKTLDFASIMQDLEVAEERAAKQLDSRNSEGDPFGPPSTTIHELTKSIKQAAKRRL